MSIANVSPYKWCKKWDRVSHRIWVLHNMEDFMISQFGLLNKYICYLILSVVQKSPHINYRLEFAQEPTPVDC
jgi:predicted peptidase